MKKILLLGCCACVVGVHTNAFAIALANICTEIVCPSLTDFSSPGCSSTNTECYENNSTGVITTIVECTECEEGYELTQTSQACGIMSIPYNVCTSACADCTDCTSDTTWSSTVFIGYEKKITRTCDCGTCVATTEFRCAAGYYGSSTDGMSGCTRCPTETGVYADSGLTTLMRGTSDAGSLFMLSCYIPSGTVFYDSTGSGQYDGDTIYCY